MIKTQNKPAETSDAFIALRILEVDGESRANVLRIIAIGIFYAIELINFYGLNLPGLELPRVIEISASFHQAVTGLAVAGSFLCLGIWFYFQKRIFSPIIKYVTTGVDALLITFVLLLADGPRSPLCVVYFLIIILSALRFSLPLIWFSTTATAFGYLAIVVNTKWYRPQYVVPHYYIFIFSVSLILAGVILGQILRKVRRQIQRGRSYDRIQ